MVIFLTLGKKNKRLGLEDAIKTATRNLERLANPKVNVANFHCRCDSESLLHDNLITTATVVLIAAWGMVLE